MFAGKYGLITLRDLFRWAERYRRSPVTSCQFRDWEQQLAEDGIVFIMLEYNIVCVGCQVYTCYNVYIL